MRPRGGLHARLHYDGDAVVLTLPDRTVHLPAVAAPALRQLLAGSCTAADLVPAGLDEAGALVLVRRMLREGVVVPAAGRQ